MKDEGTIHVVAGTYIYKIKRQRTDDIAELLRGTALSALIEALSCPENEAVVPVDRSLVGEAVKQLASARRGLEVELTLVDNTDDAIFKLEESAQIMAIPGVKAVEYAFNMSLALEVHKSVFMDILHDNGHFSELLKQHRKNKRTLTNT